MGKRKPNFLDNMIDKVYERQRREQRQGCKFLIFATAGIIVLGIVMMIVGAITAAVEENNVVSTYGEQLANLCNPMPVGSESLDNAPQGEVPLKLLILKADTRQRHAWFQDVPALWRAESQEDVDLVVCVQEERTTLETCSYERDSARGGGTFTIRLERVQYNATAVAVNPNTGRRIASLTLEGAEPESCPEDTPEITNSKTLAGEKLTFADIATWIESFVFGE